jgi:hypothetical protein
MHNTAVKLKENNDEKLCETKRKNPYRNDAKICGNGSGFASGNEIMKNERCETGAPHSGTEQMRITAFHLHTVRTATTDL